jgi:transposase
MIEIITGRERRRRWSVADKLRIVAESQEPGVRVCDVAARHDVRRRPQMNESPEVIQPTI